MLLQPTAVVPWSASATDTPKLRSLLLYPQCYPTTTLHHHPSNTYALSLETAGLTQQQGAKPFTRFTVYGNNGSDTPSAPCCPYTDAAQHIVSLTTTPTLKGSAIPADAVEPVTEVLTQHGWSRSYSIPCTQFVVDADSIIQQHQQQHQQAVPQLAPGYSLDPHGLRHDDSELVDSLWTFRSDHSLPMIQQLIAGSHTSCVRLQDGSPVAWMLEVEPLCAGMLHVLQQHRRQGLAKAVCLDLFSKLQHKWQQHRQQRDLTAVIGADVSGPPAVYCYVVADNTSSLQLMQQALQLKNTGVFSWMGFERVTDSS